MAEPVFEEFGARWRVVAIGPVLCLVVLVADLFIGAGVHLLGLALFAVLLAGLVALQVVAARRHASVEVTDAALRCGTETVALADIAEVLPEADPFAEDLRPWESARALGDLSGVPRRRTSIGLRLRGGELVRAWARDGDGLRAILEDTVEGDGEGSGR
ncbi:hypothetical protein FK531_12375 [Rhodococcus spelaei]|uniref:Uncharacterized protein n=1 Tax=Rhodococcus spelaei TaxID=2546320 RepID=A0A541B8F8_9NOCA|nr:hypothetical protein [Rhodococcus spelaei]TQF68609.1 hypothetical protein FK531_12375 [Rhodococcus spelaei]